MWCEKFSAGEEPELLLGPRRTGTELILGVCLYNNRKQTLMKINGTEQPRNHMQSTQGKAGLDLVSLGRG